MVDINSTPNVNNDFYGDSENLPEAYTGYDGATFNYTGADGVTFGYLNPIYFDSATQTSSIAWWAPFGYTYGTDSRHYTQFFHFTHLTIYGTDSTTHGDGLSAFVPGFLLASTTNPNDGVISVEFHGGDGDDTLTGGVLSDKLYGDAGDDILDSGGGTGETLDGGSGYDTLDIDRSAWDQGIVLAAGQDTTLSDGTTVTGIEFLRNIITGTGNDTLTFTLGRAGHSDNSTFNGGAGDDTAIVDYSASTDAVSLAYSNFVNNGAFVVSTTISKIYLNEVENVTVFGGSGNDNLDATRASNASAQGTGVINATLHGGDGNDTLTGSVGNDNLYGDAGDDTLDAGSGVGETLDGGADYDILSMDRSDATYSIVMSVNTTSTILDGSLDGTEVKNIEFFKNIETGSGDDSVSFTLGRVGHGDNSTFNGGAGNDTAIVDYSASTDAVSLAYNNSVNGGAFVVSTTISKIYLNDVENVTVFGGSGNDNLDATRGFNASEQRLVVINATLHGGDGNDTLTGSLGNDNLYGDAGDDTLDSGAGVGEMLDGGADYDILSMDRSEANYNIVMAVNANNTIQDGAVGGTVVKNIEFFQNIQTGSGDDTVTFGMARDTAHANSYYTAGLGNDTAIVDYSTSTSAVTLSYNRFVGAGVWQVQGSASLIYLNAIENLTVYGSASDDNLDATHSSLADANGAGVISATLYGGGGNDTLTGSEFSDNLYGDAGDDTLDAGKGSHEILDGGDDYDSLSMDRSADTQNIALSPGGDNTLSDGTQVKNIEFFKTILTGSGNDQVFFRMARDEAHANSYFDAGGGDDTAIADYNLSSSAVNVMSAADFNGQYITHYFVSGSGGHVDLYNIEHLTVFGTTFNDQMSAYAEHKGTGVAAATFFGYDGDDTFTSGFGNDSFDGGNGTDQVNFNGYWSDYIVTYNADTLTYTIADQRTGENNLDGTDHVTWIENFSFYDGVRTAGNVLTAPGLALEKDSAYGADNSDKITNDGTVNVTGLAAHEGWEYSTDGNNWTAGTGTSFAFSFTGEGEHTAYVRQTDGAGDYSDVRSLTFTLDTVAPSAPSAVLDADTAQGGGTNSDGITSNGMVDVSGLENGAWEYSVNGGDWTTGTGSSFTLMGDGVKDILVRQYDLAGNRSTATEIQFTLDTLSAAATGLADAAIANGVVNNSGDTADQTLTGMAEAGSTVHILKNGTEVGHVTADGNTGAWSYLLGVLPDGHYSYTAKTEDVAGNAISAASTALVFDVSTSTTPILALVSDTGASVTDNITSNGNVTVGNIAQGAAWEYSTDAGKHWTTGTNLDIAISGDGAKTLQVRLVNDHAAATSLAFTLDTKAPAAPAKLADAGVVKGYVNALHNTSGQTITGTAEANALVTITDNGQDHIVTATPKGVWTYTLDVLSEGNHSITAKVTDTAGNTSVASAALTFKVDTTISTPTLALANDTGSPNNDAITKDGTINVANIDSDATWQYSVDNGKSWKTGTGSSAVITGDGAKNVLVRETDAAGNVSSNSNSLAFTLDTKAPTTPAKLADAGNVKGFVNAANDTNAQALTGTAAAGDKVVIYDNGVPLAGFATADSHGVWSYTLGHLADGVHSLTAKVTDTAGNVATSAALVFTVDATVPGKPAAALVTDSAPGGTANTDNITNVGIINGVADSGNVVTIIDNGAKHTVTAASTGAWSYKLSGDAVHNLQITQADKAGNVSVAADLTSVTLDTKLTSVAIATKAGHLGSHGIGDTVNLQGTGEAGATIQIQDNHSNVGGQTITIDSSGHWSTELTLNSATTHSLTAIATDLAGNNKTSSAVSFVTDTQITAPLNALTVNGTAAADHIVIDSSNDHVNAGAGDDTVTINDTTGFFHLDGGAGIDTVDLSLFQGTMSVDLGRQGLVDLALGFGNNGSGFLTGFENVIGGSDDDLLKGDGNANVLIGGGGDDMLSGNGGTDTLTGGAGHDTFFFSTGFGKDVITDFTLSGNDSDKVDLSGTGFADLASVIAKMTNSGADVVLKIDASTTLTFTGLHVSDFTNHSADFIFSF